MDIQRLTISGDAADGGDNMEKPFSKYMTESTKLSEGPPACYQLQLDRVNLDKLSDKESQLRKFTLGKRDPNYPNKVILLVGATGTGKSTLINTMVNFVMGVKFEDKVWFEIITDEKGRPEAESQTSEVSVYEVFGFEGTTVPYSLTIIDTPGYGDTRGIEYDDVITKKLQELFCAPGGVDFINVVGLVLKASENRIDERLSYIFNSVTSIFGKEMEKNIVALFTHSDGIEPENALQALEQAQIKYATTESNEPIYFLFNNQQKKKIGKTRNAERAQQTAFETSEDGMLEFTKFLEKTQPQSLESTAEVMKERKRLNACIENFQERVAHLENNQKAIAKNTARLQKLQKEIADPSFLFEKSESCKEREQVDGTWFNKALTCNKCQETCHNTCFWGAIPSCCVVIKNGKCTVCSGKCSAEHHVHENWRYVTRTKTVKVTVQEMQKRFTEMVGETKLKYSLLGHLQEETKQLEKDKDQCLDGAFGAIEQLDKIALNVDAVSTYVHLGYLIHKMKDEEKVKKLQMMKSQIESKSKGAAHYFMKSVKVAGKALLAVALL